MKQQPLDLSAGSKSGCSDCRELRREVQEAKDLLRFLIAQFSSFSSQWHTWQRSQPERAPPKAQNASPSGSVLSASSNGSPSTLNHTQSSPSLSPHTRKRTPSQEQSPTSPKCPKTETLGGCQLPTLSHHGPPPNTNWPSSFWFLSNAFASMPPPLLNGQTSPNMLLSPPILPVQSVIQNQSKVQQMSVIQSTSALDAAYESTLQQQDKELLTRRRPGPDDFVKEYVERAESPAGEFVIPVSEAIACDPNFRPVSEEQILHSVKWTEMEPNEAVIRLSKKLAEKRVFGPMLMSQATVAGTNHSSYPNLPLEGIQYIEAVCRRVLYPGVSRQEFACHFRPAIKRLAARCRRIRHSFKDKPNLHDDEDDDDDVDITEPVV